MKYKVDNPALFSFFQKYLKAALTDLDLYDSDLVDYIAAVATRFARTERLFALKDLSGKRLTTVVEMLLEAEEHSHVSFDRFNPGKERQIRQHIGDYTLFMTGLFREYIQNLGVMDLYFEKGKESYRAVSELEEMAHGRSYPLFNLLARRFEHLSGGMDYMKKVYFTRGLGYNWLDELLRNLEPL